MDNIKDFQEQLWKMFWFCFFSWQSTVTLYSNTDGKHCMFFGQAARAWSFSGALTEGGRGGVLRQIAAARLESSEDGG